eukprot:49272-Chlamydomonas_euryale.AAC.3
MRRLEHPQCTRMSCASGFSTGHACTWAAHVHVRWSRQCSIIAMRPCATPAGDCQSARDAPHLSPH